MIEPVYVPYEQYREAKTRCGLDSRIYGNCLYSTAAALPFPLQKLYMEYILWNMEYNILNL
jgi:hypothetical protein